MGNLTCSTGYCNCIAKDTEIKRCNEIINGQSEELAILKGTDGESLNKWLKSFGFALFCELKHGPVGEVLSLLQDGWISRGKAAEAIAEIMLGNTPPLPEGKSSAFGDLDIPGEVVTALRAEVAMLREALGKVNDAIEKIHDEWAEPCASADMGQIASICLTVSLAIDTALAASTDDWLGAKLAEATKIERAMGHQNWVALQDIASLDISYSGNDTFLHGQAMGRQDALLIAQEALDTKTSNWLERHDAEKEKGWRELAWAQQDRLQVARAIAEKAEAELSDETRRREGLERRVDELIPQVAAVEAERDGLLKRLHDGVVFSREALADRDARIRAGAGKAALLEAAERTRWQNAESVAQWLEKMAEEADRA